MFYRIPIFAVLFKLSHEAQKELILEQFHKYLQTFSLK